MRIWDPHCHIDRSNSRSSDVAGHMERMIEIGSHVGIERFGAILVVDPGDRPRSIS